ncbi:MAG: hypothetical protein FJ398_16460 [Verrucomicrobia bacterium]|nr:hypothetical protein [Verrucomicrobiota bacterium]
MISLFFHLRRAVSGAVNPARIASGKGVSKGGKLKGETVLPEPPAAFFTGRPGKGKGVLRERMVLGFATA